MFIHYTGKSLSFYIQIFLMALYFMYSSWYSNQIISCISHSSPEKKKKETDQHIGGNYMHKEKAEVPALQTVLQTLKIFIFLQNMIFT